MCQYFTVIRHCGFGDYASTVNKVGVLLGPAYKFIVLNDYKYHNYHCKSLDFLSLFYKNPEIDLGIENFQHLNVSDLIKYNSGLNDDNKILVITVNNVDHKLLDHIRYNTSIFQYTPQSNPFGHTKTNKAVLHIRASDILYLSSRRVISPIAVKGFIENFAHQRGGEALDLIICSDLEQHNDNTLFQQIHDFSNGNNIFVLKKIIGRGIKDTIETMDSLYYANIIFSKNSSFIYLFTKNFIRIPDEYCFTKFKEEQK